MTVKEMHIEVEQSTQQIASNRGRGFLPEEIDWILNKMQERFISSCIVPKKDGSGGFEVSQAHADYIRMLITQKTLTPYIQPHGYSCFLPGNYRNLLADSSYTYNLCNTVAVHPVTPETLFITKQNQYKSEKEARPFYETMELQMPGITLSLTNITAGVNDQYAGLSEVDDWSFIVPLFLYYGNQTKDLYWEYLGNSYYKGAYITVDTEEPEGAVGITVDGDDHMNGVTSTVIMQKHVNVNSSIVNNRLCPSDLIPALNQSHYRKTAYYSPISELSGSYLLVYANDSFIVTGVNVVYVRKPRPISLSLGSDCELAGEKTHQIICDFATEYIKGTVQNVEGRNLKSADIAERVII